MSTFPSKMSSMKRRAQRDGKISQNTSREESSFITHGGQQEHQSKGDYLEMMGERGYYDLHQLNNAIFLDISQVQIKEYGTHYTERRSSKVLDMFAPILFLFSLPSPHNHPGLSDPTYHGHSTEPTVALLLSLSPAAVSDDHRQRGGRTRTGETAVQDRERERDPNGQKSLQRQCCWRAYFHQKQEATSSEASLHDVCI